MLLMGATYMRSLTLGLNDAFVIVDTAIFLLAIILMFVAASRPSQTRQSLKEIGQAGSDLRGSSGKGQNASPVSWLDWVVVGAPVTAGCVLITLSAFMGSVLYSDIGFLLVAIAWLLLALMLRRH